MRDNAIAYLKYLHEVESSYRSDLTTFDIAIVVEQIRIEFVRAYRER